MIYQMPSKIFSTASKIWRSATQFNHVQELYPSISQKKIRVRAPRNRKALLQASKGNNWCDMKTPHICELPPHNTLALEGGGSKT